MLTALPPVSWVLRAPARDCPKRFLALFITPFLVACWQPDVEAEVPWQPPAVALGGASEVGGSRLHPLVYQAHGEPPIRTSRFLDAERGEECTFLVADDGSYRCFPRAVAGVPFSGALYANADCTEPLYTASPLSDLEPRYIALDSERNCSSGRRLYELGASFTGEPFMGPDCTFRLVNAGRAYQLGPRIANDAFVRAAVAASGEVEDRIGGRQLSAADGSATLLGFVDTRRDAPCDARETGDGVRCVESPSYGQSSWSGELVLEGEECWNLVIDADVCAPPHYGLVIESFEPFAYSIHQVSPAEEVSTPSAAVTACLDAGRAFMTGPAYVIGETVPPVEFPPLGLSLQKGRRLDAEWLVSPQGRVVLPDDEYRYDLNDRELGVRCRLGPAPDGKTRCLPEASGASFFADSVCTVPLVAVSAGATAPAFVATSSEGAVHVFRGPDLAAEPFAGATFHQVTVTGSEYTCEPVDATSTTLVEAGTELPPETFVEYVLVPL
jgi:hypothetical protein